MKNPSCIIRRLIYYRDGGRKTSLRHKGKHVTIVKRKKNPEDDGANSEVKEVQSERKVTRFHLERRWFKAKNNVFHLHSAIYVFTPIKTPVSSERQVWRPTRAPEDKEKCQTGELLLGFMFRKCARDSSFVHCVQIFRWSGVFNGING